MGRQTHTILSRFPIGEASEASYSLHGAEDAVVFVHGYSGAAVKTWIEFPDLLTSGGELEDKDFIFWGYDSVHEHTDSCADRLQSLLNALLTSPAASRRPGAIPRKGSSPYRRIVVVAHSMGAVVARRALLLGDETNASWTSRVRLVLYAPAHHGARLELADSFLSSLLGAIWTSAQYRSPAINQLRSSSTYLDDLIQDVSAALKKSPKPSHLVALRVIHARQERILSFPEKRFGEDPVRKLIDGTHTSVCKPKSAESAAMKELREALQAWR
jgi:triacylglycerol esterase/lipase EstA (alpha/beta hydrolase family)